MKIGIQTYRWDAELDTDVCDSYNNANLTITLKLGFRQINPEGGKAEGLYHDYGDVKEPTRKIVRWAAGTWAQWKQNLCASAQQYWNGKFWLINNFDHLTYTVRGATYRPNIYCRMRIVSAHVPSIGPVDAHHVINCVRLHQTTQWFGSSARLYDSRDTQPDWIQNDSKGKRVIQRAHVHEIGHLLGLQHVDVGKPHCPKNSNTNAAACYGIADHDMHSVMGSGMGLRLECANPWRHAAVLLTQKGNADSLTDWKAELKRHYPRNTDEITANRVVDVRPHRG